MSPAGRKALAVALAALAAGLALVPAAAAQVPPPPAAYTAADAAYRAYGRGDFAAAVERAREAVRLAPGHRDYALLLANALEAAGLLEEAERTVGTVLAAGPADAGLLVRRGRLRQKLGREDAAREDYESALRAGNIEAAAAIDALAALGRGDEARLRLSTALGSGGLARLSDTDLAYLAGRAGAHDEAAAAFARAEAAGRLAPALLRDAGFAALRAHRDAQAISYFSRAIDAAHAATHPLSAPELLAARRAVSEVSREAGVFASVSHRGSVPGLGQSPGSEGDSLQGGIEAYWRPWGYRNSTYVELFARAFGTFDADAGSAGTDSVQSGLGARWKPFPALNLVGSLSRVFAPKGAHDDWLVQAGYSGGIGTDPRVDASRWWTARLSAEAGRYLSARQDYALAQVEAGHSFRLDGCGETWVLFPHVALAADRQSNAIRRDAAGAGVGIGARCWFRGDAHHAPRSWFDLTLQYRWRLSGADRAEGFFLTATLAY